MRLSWLGRMILVGRTRSRVPVLVHWSVPALCLFFLGSGAERILTGATAIASYIAVLVTHELGHQIVAQWRGCRVTAIKIYPIHGSYTYEGPASRYDQSLIAWGGPLAQFIVAVPLVAYVLIFGPSRFEPVDAIFAILGFFSVVIAFLNLIPIEPLDGRKAWAALPLLFSRMWDRLRRRRPLTAMEAMEEALRKASKRRGG